MATFILLLIVAPAMIAAVPVTECNPQTMFIADHEDLCRYHWCIGQEQPVEMRCAPGARVPTWFETSPADSEIPCVLDHSTDITCLRCDYNPDGPIPGLGGDCDRNPCPADCECQNNWNSHYCLCGGNIVAPIETVTSGNFYCSPDPCRNGATCHSQWDDYWCECPPGYTGKNCETFFCDDHTCKNGGRCVVDGTNYHCECTDCFNGPCCMNQIGDGRNCAATPDTGNVTPETTTPKTYTTPTTCTACQYGDRCQYTREWLCECNPCQSGQICYDRTQPYTRECLGKPGPYGSQYTLTFSQDHNGGSQYKRVYVNVGGMSLIGTHQVRIYTPNIRRGEPCFVDRTVSISLNNPAFHDVPAECLNTEGDNVQGKKVLKVLHVRGKQIVVTVANMDGDGYLAIPDVYAGLYFVSHTYSKSGETQYITVVALEDNTEVRIQKPDQEIFSVGAVNADVVAKSNVNTYNLNALESFRYELNDGNLLGTVILSNKNIHVWTGNFDSSSQKTQEQLPAVNRWAPTTSSEYVYIIVGISDSRLGTRDEVHVEVATQAEYLLLRVGANGEKTEVSRGTLSANSMTVLGELRAGETFELITTQPAQVTHNIIGNNDRGQSFYSAYSLVPAITQYAQSYSFQTHGSRNNLGSDYTTHYLTLVSQRGALADVPDYFEQLVIYHHDPVTGVTQSYSPQDLGARWVNVRGFYNGARIELPRTGIYYVSNPSLENYAFCALYYGVSGNRASQQPNTAFPLGYRLDQVNNIPPPVICDRCMTGPECNRLVIHTCACNPCDNFDDICTDSADPLRPRECKGIVDTTGNPFTLMFMQNRPDNTERRELEVYATPAGTASQVVRLFTPFLPRTDPCFLDTEKRINGFEVSLFNVPNPDCYETIGSGTFHDKALRVQSDGGDLLVYAVNRDQFSADGWVAFPDAAAGTDFYAVCHSPAVYGTEFAVLNIQDVAVDITLTYTERGNPDVTGRQFRLQAGEVLQIQSANDKSDLSGTRIQSSLPVNVYSGNIRALVDQVEDPTVGNINTGSRDHLVEQLMPVSRWGTVFHIQPIPDRRFGDQVKIIASGRGTRCTIYRREPSGTVSDRQFNLGQGDVFTGDVVSGSTYRVVCSKRVFVAQITKSQERGSNIHDPSLITIPPVEQYANRYIFNTPSFSGGSGNPRPYQFRLVLVSAKEEDRDGIEINHSGSRGSTTRRLSDMGTWVQVPGTDYYNIVGELEVGTSLIFHRKKSASFMCIFYGYDDRESLGFPIGMRLQKIENERLMFNSANMQL